jgi:UDP-glucose 4-epimerase
VGIGEVTGASSSAARPGGSFAVVGGAGFIGGHLTERLLSTDAVSRVVVYDNFSSGREWHLDAVRADRRLEVVRAAVEDFERLRGALVGCDTVVHLASNPDIARAMTEPRIDFDAGTLLTQNVVEAVRQAGCRRLLYASGSGVYGDWGDAVVTEDQGPLLPVSTYGASKLAGEALICSYVAMFGLTACGFRFGNVVGPRQTHGVGYDFVLSLLRSDDKLRILGDGQQSKPYIHIEDVMEAVLLANDRSTKPYDVFNVAPLDYSSVKEIADIAVAAVVGHDRKIEYEYSGGRVGWKGDVPVVRLSTERIRALGWANKRSSNEAIEAAIIAMLADARAGRLSGPA